MNSYVYIFALFATVSSESVCVPPEYFLSETNTCSRVCPFGFYANHTTATCEQWPNNFQVIHNASAYYAIIQVDNALPNVLFDYEVFINENTVGQFHSISLSLTSTDTQTENIFIFDNEQNQKVYSTSDESIDGDFPEQSQNDTTFFQEQIKIMPPIPDTLNNVLLSLTLSTRVLGSQYSSTLFIAIYNSSELCEHSICSNGGTCVPTNAKNDQFICHCPVFYTGPFCETFNSCRHNPCQNALCRANEYLGYAWSKTEVGDYATAPCPCEEILGVCAGRVRRLCTGSLTQGAEWSMELNDSSCETKLSESSEQLCNIALLLEGSQTVAKRTAEITSSPHKLTFTQIILSTYIVENLSEEAAKKFKVREYYLQIIDNLLQARPNEMIKSGECANSSTRLLLSLESFLDNVDITNVAQNTTSNTTTYSFTSFAIKLHQIDADKFNGHTFIVNLGPVEQAKNISGHISINNLLTFNKIVNAKELSEGNITSSTASVWLNPLFYEQFSTFERNDTSSIGKQHLLKQRLSYIVFLTDILFLPENNSLSKVGSIAMVMRSNILLENGTSLAVPVRVEFDTEPEGDTNITKSCAMYSITNGYGAWDREGCIKVNVTKDKAMCKCSQLGHFGILFDFNPTPLPRDFSITLGVISYVGLALSTICLIVFTFTCLLSKKLRAKTHNRILVNMSFSLMGVYITFLAGSLSTEIPALCGIVSASLQYVLLAYFSWTAVEAVWLYLKLVAVLKFQSFTSHYVLKAGLSAWLFPGVIVIISVGAGHQYYANHYFCRPTEWPFYFGFILPFLAVYIFNWIIFCFIIASLCKCTIKTSERDESVSVNKKKIFIISMSLAVVLGFGWGFGLAVTSSDLAELTFTLQLIFSVFVGSQGVLIFILHGIRNADFREFWMRLPSTVSKVCSGNKNPSRRKVSVLQLTKGSNCDSNSMGL